MNRNDYEYRVSAAGRVNLIGEHIDYCGGKVMPCALSLKSTVCVRPNGTNTIRLAWTDLPDKITLDIAHLGEYRHLRHAKYHAGCAYLWQQAGHPIVGCDMLLDCTVPFGSGLSSSAAIEVSAISALALMAGEHPDPVEVALVAQRAEREYAGVNCGIMDQYASACGRAGHAMLLDCKTLACEYVPVNTGDYALIILNSNKPHNLVESRYNERRAETEIALGLLQSRLHVSCLAEVTSAELEKNKDLMTDVVYRRAKHVVEECERVRLAAKAMKEGTMSEFGRLLSASHASLSSLYEVTGFELDSLAAAAQAHPACAGSRMTGAGFGGCTVSLVQKDGVTDFKNYVLSRYRRETGYDAICYEAEIADGIVIEKI